VAARLRYAVAKARNAARPAEESHWITEPVEREAEGHTEYGGGFHMWSKTQEVVSSQPLLVPDSGTHSADAPPPEHNGRQQALGEEEEAEEARRRGAEMYFNAQAAQRQALDREAEAARIMSVNAQIAQRHAQKQALDRQAEGECNMVEQEALPSITPEVSAVPVVVPMALGETALPVVHVLHGGPLVPGEHVMLMGPAVSQEDHPLSSTQPASANSSAAQQPVPGKKKGGSAGIGPHAARKRRSAGSMVSAGWNQGGSASKGGQKAGLDTAAGEDDGMGPWTLVSPRGQRALTRGQSLNASDKEAGPPSQSAVGRALSMPAVGGGQRDGLRSSSRAKPLGK
jgi:hypothetical protein